MNQPAQQSFRDRSGRPLELVLYKYDACPFCVRVMQRAQQLGFDLPRRDTRRDDGARDELLRLGGKPQVPCLFVNGQPMYESADIIAFLENELRRN
jgi:glutaredoxin 2